MRAWVYRFSGAFFRLALQSLVVSKVLAVHPGCMRTNMGGQEASISPDESAEGIFQLADKEWQAEDPIYMDYLGNPLPW